MSFRDFIPYSPARAAAAAASPQPASFEPAAPPAAQPFGGPAVSWSGSEAWEHLPGPAREKFLALRDEAEDLHVGLEPLRERISELRIDREKAESRISQIERETISGLHGGDLPGLASEREKAARIAAEMDRQQQRYDARAAAWRAKRAVVTNLETYLRRYGGPFTLAAPVATPQPAKGESVLDTIARLRQKLETLREDRQSILDAPVPSTQAKQIAIQQIEALAERGRPGVVALIDGAREIAWPSRYELAAPVLGPDGRLLGTAGRDRSEVDAHALLAWLHKDALIARICAEIDSVADDHSALDASTRAKKLAQADEAILATERLEESAIMEALAAGFAIDRRPDADARAILGLEGPAPRS